MNAILRARLDESDRPTSPSLYGRLPILMLAHSLLRGPAGLATRVAVPPWWPNHRDQGRS